MLKLLFIRHGESTGNRAGRMSGHEADRLTAQGQQQCRQLAHHLHRQRWRPSHIYSSPLQRALDSVAELAAVWQWQLSAPPDSQILPVSNGDPRELLMEQGAGDLPQLRIVHQLQEFDAGILTGLTWREAQQQYPDLCQALETSPDWVPIPHAETPLAGRSRAADFVNYLLAKHQNGDAVWLISHQWIMEHLIACLMGCDRTWQMPMANTATFEFWLDRDRWSASGVTQGISDLWQIKRFNDCQHLSEESEPRAN
ncbi:MAG: histidine phosphatase family protein [Leptolyngbyaceae cyanobacterium]